MHEIISYFLKLSQSAWTSDRCLTDGETHYFIYSFFIYTFFIGIYTLLLSATWAVGYASLFELLTS